MCCLLLVVLSFSFTRLAVFPPLTTSTKHCHWTITDSAQMTSEIALFPLPCTHMSQMLFGWEWLRAKIKRDVPLAIELTVRSLVFSSIIHFCWRAQSYVDWEAAVWFLCSSMVHSPYYQPGQCIICSSDESSLSLCCWMGCKQNRPLGL